MTVFDTPSPFETTPRMATAAEPKRDGTEVIAETAVVEPGARVITGSRVLQLAHLSGQPTVSNHSVVRDLSHVSDYALVTNRAVVAGQAVVSGQAVVDAAEVTGTTYLADFARIRNYAKPRAGVIDLSADLAGPNDYVAAGPIGSEGRIASFYRAFNPENGSWVGVVAAGCFRGTIDRLLHRLEVKEAWNEYNNTEPAIKLWDAQYRAFLDLARTLEETWGEPDESDLAFWQNRMKHSSSSYLVERMAGYGLLR
ncbi:MAG: hypothetical protein ACJ780_31585 [Solirubrobacteraceae bacterium]